MYYSLCLNAQGLLFMHRQKCADTEMQLRKRYCLPGWYHYCYCKNKLVTPVYTND